MTDAGTIVTFEPPGPGTWEHDLSHCPPAATPLFQRVASTTMTTTYRVCLRALGSTARDDGGAFRRGQDVPPPRAARRRRAHGPPPPNAVLWLATRLHPAFRRRERLARKTLAERPYLDVVDGWYAGEREAWIDRNLAMQAIDPATLDDAGAGPSRRGPRRPPRAGLAAPPRPARQRPRADRRPARPRQAVGSRPGRRDGAAARGLAGHARGPAARATHGRRTRRSRRRPVDGHLDR